MRTLGVAWLSSVLFYLIILLPFWGHSAIVIKIKKNKTFVHLEGEEALPGDYYQALDLYGKPRGILRISKVRNGKAIATIIQGTAGTNWILEKTDQSALRNNSLDSAEVVFPKHNIGFLAGGLTHVGDKEKGQVNIRGFGGVTSIFLERFHTSHFSSQLLIGLSYSQLNQKCRGNNTRNCIIDRSGPPLNYFIFPEIGATFFFRVNIYTNVNFFIGAGASISKWHNINNNYTIIAKTNFQKTVQPSGHLTLGFNITPKDPQFRIPISITYSKVQAFAELYEKYIKEGSALQDSVNLIHFSIQIGIAKDF